MRQTGHRLDSGAGTRPIIPPILRDAKRETAADKRKIYVELLSGLLFASLSALFFCIVFLRLNPPAQHKLEPVTSLVASSVPSRSISLSS